MITPFGPRAMSFSATTATAKPITFGCNGCDNDTPLKSSKVSQATASDFEDVVLKAKTPVLVDFYADWCPPCQALAPILEDLATINPKDWPQNTRIAKVDVDAEAALKNKYNIRSMPTLVLFNQGQEVARWSGLADKPTLIKRLAQALPTEKT